MTTKSTDVGTWQANGMWLMSCGHSSCGKNVRFVECPFCHACSERPRVADRPWQPPFCSDDADENMVCPVPSCGQKGTIQIRAQDYYTEGGVEAYCSECHTMLEVQAQVNITFSDPEVVE